MPKSIYAKIHKVVCQSTTSVFLEFKRFTLYTLGECARKMVERIKLELPVSIKKEGQLYVATCPVFNVASQGYSEREALDNVREALTFYVNDEDIQRQYHDKINQHVVKDTVECVTVEMNDWQKTPHSIGA